MHFDRERKTGLLQMFLFDLEKIAVIANALFKAGIDLSSLFFSAKNKSFPAFFANNLHFYTH